MLISSEQNRRFWREWSACCRAQRWTKDNGWTPAQIDNERHALLARAGFDSLTLVDRVAGFTAVLKELAALRDDVHGLMRAEGNERRVLLHGIRTALSTLNPQLPNSQPSEYIAVLPRFDRTGCYGHCDLESLPLSELEHLRNLLTNRARKKRPPLSTLNSKHSQPANLCPAGGPPWDYDAPDNNEPF